MSVLNNSLLLGQEGGAGYVVQRSLRFSSIDSAFCSRSVTAGNQKTWSLSFWLKRAALGTDQEIFATANGDLVGFVRLTSGNLIRVFSRNASAVTQYDVSTVAVLRDCSAWYHILVVQDTTQAASGDRIKIYINGTLQTLTTATAASLNADCAINSTNTHNIGNQPGASVYLSAYLADVVFADGQALTPSSLTEVSATTGQLIPKKYSGPTPTGNSFWLPFSDNSAATATTLGKDGFLLGNNWTLNNFVASYTGGTNYTSGTTVENGSVSGWFDGLATVSYEGFIRPQTLASFTNLPTATTGLRIYCWAQNANQGNFIVNGNSTSISTGTSGTFEWSDLSSLCPITLTSFKTSAGSPGDGLFISAIEVNGTILVDSPRPSDVDSLVDTPTSYGTDTGAGGEVRGNYATWNPLATAASLANGNLDITNASAAPAGSSIQLSSGKWYYEFTVSSLTDSQWVAVGLPKHDSDLANFAGYRPDSGQYYNGSGWVGYGATYGVGDVIGVAVDLTANTIQFYKNGVGQGQLSRTFTVAVGPVVRIVGSANFGQRQWAYAAPAGFKALCDTNLPAPVVAKPNTIFDAILWTGNGTSSARTISGLLFSPDLVWGKSRVNADSHVLSDTVRGTGKDLLSNSTIAEIANNQYGYISAFNSDGFSTTPGSTNNSSWNVTNAAMVAWCWDAGSSTVTNTQGSITSSCRTNQSSGFSIITFNTQASGTATVGHGLGVTPEMFIIKARTVANQWWMYHKSLPTPQSNAIALNLTNAALGSTTLWNNTAPTSSVLHFDSGWAGNNPVVVYAWTPVAGYSSAFSYTGTNSSEGPFVHLGFKPRLILVKRTDAAQNWFLFDSARNTYNSMGSALFPNLSDAENTGNNDVDFLSNGFKIRFSGTSGINQAGTYIGFAWAENPFAYARAR